MNNIDIRSKFSPFNTLKLTDGLLARSQVKKLIKFISYNIKNIDNSVTFVLSQSSTQLKFAPFCRINYIVFSVIVFLFS